MALALSAAAAAATMEDDAVAANVVPGNGKADDAGEGGPVAVARAWFFSLHGMGGSSPQTEKPRGLSLSLRRSFLIVFRGWSGERRIRVEGLANVDGHHVGEDSRGLKDT